MSTRARTRAAVAAAAATAPSTTTSSYAAPTKPTSKPSSVKGRQNSTATISPIKQQQQQQTVVAEPFTAKENLKMASNTTTTRITATNKQSSAKSKAILKANVAYCTCHRGDDGSPMIRCAECKLWCVTRVAWPSVPNSVLLTQPF